MFTNPFFRLQDAGYEGGRAQLDGLYNGRRYGVHQYISMYSMRNMNRDEHFLSQVIVQPMADQIVAGVEAVRRESLIRGHTHNTATYLDEALRMPDNMSCFGNDYTRTAEGVWTTPGERIYQRGYGIGNPPTIAEIDRRINGSWETEEASKKARELLFSLLTEEQQEEYIEHNRIVVLSERGNLYKVKRHCEQNIYLLNSNDPDDWNTRYCAGISGMGIPLDDKVAAQVLMLQGNED